MPRQLSGGQAQRVALARALAADPDVLLLDEPLAGLDVATATAMRKLLRSMLNRDGRSAVLITHDLLDVLTLADRVLVLESGRVAEIGSAAAVLAAPRSHFGARFAGVNLVSGTAGPDGALNTEWGTAWHGNPAPDVVVGQPAVAVFPPAAVAVYRDKPHGSPRNTVEVTVAELDSRGTRHSRAGRGATRWRAGPRRRHHRRVRGRAAVGAGGAGLLLGQGAGDRRSSGPVTACTPRLDLLNGARATPRGELVMSAITTEDASFSICGCQQPHS